MDRLTWLKMLFGFMLLGSLVALAVMFGMGHVEEKTSFGLREIVIALVGLGGAFGAWAFGSRNDRNGEK